MKICFLLFHAGRVFWKGCGNKREKYTWYCFVNTYNSVLQQDGLMRQTISNKKLWQVRPQKLYTGLRASTQLREYEMCHEATTEPKCWAVALMQRHRFWIFASHLQVGGLNPTSDLCAQSLHVLPVFQGFPLITPVSTQTPKTCVIRWLAFPNSLNCVNMYVIVQCNGLEPHPACPHSQSPTQSLLFNIRKKQRTKVQNKNTKTYKGAITNNNNNSLWKYQ